jgi:small-conductance mechanosensitive channel
MNTLIQIEKLAKVLTRHNQLFSEVKDTLISLQTQINDLKKSSNGSSQSDHTIKNLTRELDDISQEVHDLKKAFKNDMLSRKSKIPDQIVTQVEDNSESNEEQLIGDVELELELKKIDTTSTKKKKTVTKKKTTLEI